MVCVVCRWWSGCRGLYCSCGLVSVRYLGLGFLLFGVLVLFVVGGGGAVILCLMFRRLRGAAFLGYWALGCWGARFRGAGVLGCWGARFRGAGVLGC